MPRRPTTEEILDISERVVDIFQSYGLRSCLFGSTACNLFGVSRTPNDVDVVVFTERYDQEELKEFLVNDDDDFYLVSSRNPNADYRVLWCRLPGRAGRRRRKCKVDILLPGVLNIPLVPRRRIKVISGLPVMPLVPLLLLKLQGWSDHRASNREDMQEKQYVDVEDISELLDVAVERDQNIWQNNLSWVPRDLLDDAQDRVVDYIEEYPDSADSWEELGLGVSTKCCWFFCDCCIVSACYNPNSWAHLSPLFIVVRAMVEMSSMYLGRLLQVVSDCAWPSSTLPPRRKYHTS